MKKSGVTILEGGRLKEALECQPTEEEVTAPELEDEIEQLRLRREHLTATKLNAIKQLNKIK